MRQPDEGVGADRVRRAVAEEPGGYVMLFELAVALRARFERSRDNADLDEAIETGRQALAVLPAGQPDRPAVLSHLAATLRTRFEYSGNRDDLDEAVATAREALAGTEQNARLRPGVLSNLAATLTARSEFTGDLSDLDEAIDAIREVLVTLPDGHVDRPAVLSNLAAALRSRAERTGDADLAEAVGAARAALAAIPAGHSLRAKAQSTLARALHLSGQHEQAAAELRSVLAARTESLGGSHPDTLATRQLLAGVLRDQGRIGEAERELVKVLAVRRQTLGADHPDTLATRHQLAVVLRDQGLLAEAAAEFRSILYEARRVLGEDHPDTLATERMLAVVDEETGRVHDRGPAVSPADQDPLTGVLSRAAFMTKSTVALSGLSPADGAVLVLLDLDRFRDVNDTLGHTAGDAVLQVVAERLRALGQPGQWQSLARLGGDEFALLLTAASGEPLAALAERRAREIADVVARPMSIQGVSLAVTATTGLALGLAGAVDVAELLRRAEVAMYRAKSTGRGISWYDSAHDDASTQRLALLDDLRRALAAPDQFELAMQPVIDLSTGAPIEVEALVRWRHPRAGTLNPSQFIGAVENSSLIGPLTRHVIDMALRHAARWAAEGVGLPVAVNLSARTLVDPQLHDDVAALLRRYRLPANQLILEITESAVFGGDRAEAALNQLRSQGVQLAVVDFGTGYSSFTFLTRMAVQEIKIDRSFISRMGESPEAAAIVRTVIDLARALNVRTVADGVETAEQAEQLTRLGCLAGQGYYFFPPLTPARLLEYLKAPKPAAHSQMVGPPERDVS